MWLSTVGGLPQEPTSAWLINARATLRCLGCCHFFKGKTGRIRYLILGRNHLFVPDTTVSFRRSSTCLQAQRDWQFRLAPALWLVQRSTQLLLPRCLDEVALSVPCIMNRVSIKRVPTLPYGMRHSANGTKMSGSLSIRRFGGCWPKVCERLQLLPIQGLRIFG